VPGSWDFFTRSTNWHRKSAAGLIFLAGFDDEIHCEHGIDQVVRGRGVVDHFVDVDHQLASCLGMESERRHRTENSILR
jgi:hypothetical protein